MAVFERALFFDPNCIDAVYNIGKILISNGAYKEALNLLLKANEKNRNDSELLMHIAHCYYKSNDLQEALLWAEKVMQISPDHHLALLLIKKLRAII